MYVQARIGGLENSAFRITNPRALNINVAVQLGMVVHSCHPSTQDAEAGGWGVSAFEVT